MKGWKEKTFGILIACGQCDSRRGAVLCALCYCRHQGQLHLLLSVGKMSSELLWAARRDQLELTSIKVFGVIRLVEFQTTLWFLCPSGFQTFWTSTLLTTSKMTQKPDQPLSLSITHLIMNKPRNISVYWDFTEKLHNAGHHFTGCCCVLGKWQVLSVITQRHMSKSVTSLWCSGLDQHQALKLSFPLHIFMAADTDNFVEH